MLRKHLYCVFIFIKCLTLEAFKNDKSNFKIKTLFYESVCHDSVIQSRYYRDNCNATFEYINDLNKCEHRSKFY